MSAGIRVKVEKRDHYIPFVQEYTQWRISGEIWQHNIWVGVNLNKISKGAPSIYVIAYIITIYKFLGSTPSRSQYFEAKDLSKITYIRVNL